VKRTCWLLAVMVVLLAGARVGRAQSCVTQSQVTLVGTLRANNGLPSVNDTINLTPSQVGIVAGCGVNTMATTACATSVDGSVVQTPNPLVATLTSTTLTGTLPSGTYYVTYGWYDAQGHVTLAGPETVQQLGAQGSLVVGAPSSGVPATAVGMKVYIGTASGTETLQGQTVGAGSYNQSVPLVSGSALPGTNNTVCVATANDSIWPVGTGYVVTMVDPSGNALPGFPMQWQLNGAGTTINLSNGLPYYHGVVFYPTPVLAAPPAHATQSVSGPLTFGGYNVTGVGALGVGTTLPAWPIDVENGAVNASGGYIFNGGIGVAPANCLLADSDAFHTFRVPGTCVTTLPTLYYQTVKLNGSAQTQRAALNFSTRFVLSDSSSPAQTTVDVHATGNAAEVVTATAAATAGNCAQWASAGNMGDAGAPCLVVLTRGQFTAPSGSLSAGTQTTYNTGVAVSGTAVVAASVISGTISPLLVYAVSTVGGTIQLVISNPSSSSLSYASITYNYVIL
jgi:hypothetical protein